MAVMAIGVTFVHTPVALHYQPAVHQFGQTPPRVLESWLWQPSWAKLGYPSYHANLRDELWQ